MCCVEMGLGMIETMKIFDSERHEGIKMRVGIHTGKLSVPSLIEIFDFIVDSRKRLVWDRGNETCEI